VVSVLGNDAGGSGCTLQPGTLVMLTGNPVTETTLLVVPGEGYWMADADGTLTFTPEDDFQGWTSWVTYRITDSCGNSVTAQARANEPAPKTAIDDDSDDNGDGGGGSLAYTGAEVGGLIGLAAVLLAGGALLLVWRRKRQA
jgi:LPXTG-motif cell wall-anchored protein